MDAPPIPPVSPSSATPASPALEHGAVEILGALAPCEHSGPHGLDAVRRRTRLVPEHFDAAVHDLAARGWIECEGRHVWLTRPGEEVLLRLFA